jgi:hypothetical protein
MSKAPTLETQPGAAPVVARLPLDTLHGSPEALLGVPSAAVCHSALVGSRFPAFCATAAAWNQVMNREGTTPGIETA